ncbi:MAG: hypothetical protein U0T82_15395 [Bacteroidales bacterium]
MKSRFDLVKLGFFLGILTPMICFVIIYLLKSDQMTFDAYFRFLISVKALPKLMSLTVIPNLGIFFLFIYRDHYYGARGVLAATIVLAIIILVIKFVI